MIGEIHLKRLEKANREMAVCWERLCKARAGRNPQQIQSAEMAYFQALQCAYDAAVDAVAVGAA